MEDSFMVFEKEKLSKALNQHSKQKISNKGLTLAAVLIPVFSSDGKDYLLFTKRTNLVETHKGEISFPGGVHDKTDKSLLHTALRETNEELGVNAKDVEILGELDDVETNTNFIISPFVGIIPYPYNFKVNDKEIESLLYVPLESLLNGDNFWEESRDYNGGSYPMYFYRYENNIIWGATAKIVKHFSDLIQEASDK